MCVYVQWNAGNVGDVPVHCNNEGDDHEDISVSVSAFFI